jgi:hypothetical protein
VVVEPGCARQRGPPGQVTVACRHALPFQISVDETVVAVALLAMSGLIPVTAQFERVAHETAVGIIATVDFILVRSLPFHSASHVPMLALVLDTVKESPSRTQNELVAHERSEAGRDLRLLRAKRLDSAAVEDLALDRTAFEHPALRLVELVEPRRQKRLQCRRHSDLRIFRRHGEHLGDEERVARRCLGDPFA